MTDVLPWGEFRPDVADYSGSHTKNILNVLPRGDGYGPMPDIAALTSALPAACRGAFTARKDDGTVVIFAGTSTKLYKLSNTAYTWADASKGAGTYTTVNTAEQWQFAQFGNNVIAVQANTVPQVYDITGAGPFGDLGGSPPQARYVAIVSRFVVLTGLNSTPYRIQWSGLNSITTWTSGVLQSDFQDFPDGGFVRTVAGGEFGLITQDAARRRMTFIPGSTVVFQFERISDDDGIYAPYSLVRAQNRIFFCSPKGFQMVIGTADPVPIGRERVDRTLFGAIDAGNLQLFIGAADPNSTRVFWGYKSTSSGGTSYFDKGLCYDYVLDKWTPLTWTGEYLTSLMQPGVTLEGIDTLYGSNEDTVVVPGGSFDFISNASLPQLAMVNNVHKVALFTGANLEATLESSEHGAAPQRIRVRGFRPVTDAAGYYGRLSYRDLQSSASSLTSEIIVNSIGKIDVNLSTRYARGRIRIPAGTTWTYAIGVEPDASPEGLR